MTDKLEYRIINIPITPEKWAATKFPYPLTSEEWEQMLRVYEVLRPGLVVDEVNHE
jgi:hypothetical protein